MSLKKTHRKGFNFFRSYYDVFNELPEKDKLSFIEALLNKQFLGVDPSNLKGMAKFAYISQQHSISEQVKGYESKSGVKLTPCQGGSVTPCLQVEVEVEGKVEVQVKEKEKEGLVFPFGSDEFKNTWDLWKDYKKKEHRFSYKALVSEQAALKKLAGISANEANAIKIIHQSIENGWKGFFNIKENENTKKKSGVRNFTPEGAIRAMEKKRA